MNISHEPKNDIDIDSNISLKPDTVIEGQQWICTSFITPENIKDSEGNVNNKSKFRAIKFRGAFATENEATEHVKKLQKEDPFFNIYISKGFHWIPLCDDAEYAEDIVYQEKGLNELFDLYKKQLVDAKKVSHERIQKAISEGKSSTKQLIKENYEHLKRLEEEFYKCPLLTVEQKDKIESLKENISVLEKNAN